MLPIFILLRALLDILCAVVRSQDDNSFSDPLTVEPPVVVAEIDLEFSVIEADESETSETSSATKLFLSTTTVFLSSKVALSTFLDRS